RAEMREIMPELGIERTVSADEMARDSRVVELPPKAAE
ncbi:MAG TPA: DNA repair protein, partial [Sulfitobacter sp.]|nr:DNA repair protein [Sulfitobacter sp.]